MNHSTCSSLSLGKVTANSSVVYPAIIPARCVHLLLLFTFILLVCCLKEFIGMILHFSGFGATFSGLHSTTWKSTDGTASHWKHIIDSVIVYRDCVSRWF